jgi:hypothetical protein
MFCCKRCGYETIRLADLKKHFIKKKQCPATLSDIDTTLLYEEHFCKNKNKKYKCEFCDKSYLHAPSKSNHKKICKKRIEIELLQHQNQEKLNNLCIVVEQQQKKIQELEEYKNKNKNVSTINNNNNNNIQNQTINNTTNNIQINAFGKENFDYLLKDPKYYDFMTSCIKNQLDGIHDLMV